MLQYVQDEQTKLFPEDGWFPVTVARKETVISHTVQPQSVTQYAKYT